MVIISILMILTIFVLPIVLTIYIIILYRDNKKLENSNNDYKYKNFHQSQEIKVLKVQLSWETKEVRKYKKENSEIRHEKAKLRELINKQSADLFSMEKELKRTQKELSNIKKAEITVKVKPSQIKQVKDFVNNLNKE